MQNLTKYSGRLFREPKIKDPFFYWFSFVVVISLYVIGQFNTAGESVVSNSGGNYSLENVVWGVLWVLFFGTLPALIRTAIAKRNGQWTEKVNSEPTCYLAPRCLLKALRSVQVVAAP